MPRHNLGHTTQSQIPVQEKTIQYCTTSRNSNQGTTLQLTRCESDPWETELRIIRTTNVFTEASQSHSSDRVKPFEVCGTTRKIYHSTLCPRKTKTTYYYTYTIHPIFISTDAADKERGAVVKVWKKKWHRNKKDILYETLIRMRPHLKEKTLMLQTDNRVTAYIMKHGGTRSLRVLKTATNVLELCKQLRC